jgi:tetratricopeptide (TPR) repeat protein
MKNKIKRTLIIATLMFLSITGFADSDCPDGLCNLQLEKLYAYKNMDPSVTQEQAGLINLAYQEFEIDPEKALQILLEKAEIEKSEAIDFSIASFYYSLENFDQSIIWYRKALEKNETFNRARANLAQVLIRIDKIDEAVKEFEKVLQTGNVSSNTYN